MSKYLDRIKKMGGNPDNHNKFLGEDIRGFSKEELLGIIDYLLKEQHEKDKRVNQLLNITMNRK